MKILLAPAKKMVENNDDFIYRDLPVFLKESSKLLETIRGLDFTTQKKMWKCNDKIAKENHKRFEEMNLKKNLSCALFSYVGLAYQHLAPNALAEDSLEYLEENLRILSGFYGVLKPFDGIRAYRLEMQSEVPGVGSLYDYWGNKLYKEVTKKDHVIINLASEEYFRAISPYLSDNDQCITIVFGQKKGDKVIQKGTLAKMARGEMVYWLAENQISSPEDIKAFPYGYEYSKDLSTESEYVFLAKEM